MVFTKAYGYLRVSGQGQVDGDGIPRQRKAIKDYAAKNNLRIVEWFVEKGVSGKTEWEDRPAWMDMIAALNGVRTIVVEKLDRVARQLGIQERIISDLERRNVVLLSTHEPDLGNGDPTRVLFRQIMGGIAQYDRSMIEAKLRAARERKRAAEGRCEGRKPYGDRPGELTIIERMRVLRAEGYGFDRLAEQLNREGLPTRTRGRWHGVMVQRILARP